MEVVQELHKFLYIGNRDNIIIKLRQYLIQLQV